MSVAAFHESLPYIDNPSEAELQSARALITAEQQHQPQQTSSQQSPTFSPAIETELLRIASSTPLTPLNTTRYEAQELPPSSSTTDTIPILSKAYTSQVYLSSRLQSLQLLEKHGANAWLLGNYHLEAEVKALEGELAQVKREIDEVNVQRQRRQGDVSGELVGLEEAWRTGVGRVLETEIAVGEVRELVREELRKKGRE